MRRYKMSRRKSRRNFSRGATYAHKLNYRGRPMRGGIRL
jgi:hypothetical protein